MMFPIANAEPSHCHLRPLLSRWASRYTQDQGRRDQLVEMTISAAIEGPPLDFDEPIEKALCRLLHGFAIEELRLPKQTPVLCDAEREDAMIDPSENLVGKATMDALWAKLNMYAVRYHLSGPERDRLVEQTFTELSNEPDNLLERPVEQAIAETMHRVFMSGKSAH